MKKIVLSLMAVLGICGALFSQSKVFKEVSGEISTQVSAIRQDDVVIGYIAFTRLEKVSDELYSYKITIMDENLNDIGTVNFKDEKLYLQGTAFEQDVLCIAYFKTNMLDKKFGSSKQFYAARDRAKNAIKMHFLGLDGRIIDTVNTPVEIDTKFIQSSGYFYPKGELKHNLNLINIPDHGFATIYGDSKKNVLTVYEPTGKKSWQRVIKEDPVSHLELLASGQELYLLTEGSGNKEIKKHYEANSYELLSFNIKDSSANQKISIKDKKSHQLNIFTFENDPGTGKPYISGYMKSTKKRAHAKSVNGVARGHYAGIFSYNIMSPQKKDLKEVYTYWDDASNSQVSANGYLEDQQSYAKFYTSFRDFEGNTYFTADGIKRNTSAMRTAANLLWLPTIPLSPMSVFVIGTRKGRLGNPLLLKQDNNGKISCATLFEGEKYKSWYSNITISELGNRTYYTATNHDQKQQFLVVTENKTTSVYNINTHKQVRTVPLKDKKISRRVIPAKEGHILISEYNSKENSTTVSIEAL